MRKLFLTCLIPGLSVITAYSQTLFTYGNNSVSKDEFLKVYKKNSLNKEPDMSDTALKSYLDLYSLFRMKVTEAEEERLDTLPSIQHELDSYRKQLAKSYLTDEQITDKLIKEAYDRMKEDVHAEHILISCPPGSDTVRPYQKIDSIYHVILDKKSDFETMAKFYSEDKGSKDNGGDIGYFTALQTVYPFENMAYETPVGKMSAPFRTQFGYHILKVLNKREDKGQVKVAQIMISTPKSKGEEGQKAALQRADSIETMLKKGVSFAELVKKYSDDKYTVNDSGIMKPFGTGKYLLPFEDAAFALKKPGDVSQPVKTDYGYHIIKLIAKYPLQPYDSVYTQLKHKVENDSRAQTAKDFFFNKIKQQNGFKEYPENYKSLDEKFMALPDTGKAARTFKASDFRNMDAPLFSLGGKNYLQNDFANYFETLTRGRINGPKKSVLHDGYNMYVNNVVNDFEEHKLIEEKPEFRSLMEEYKDGIMLFELMDHNVWSKASHDTIGLNEFYDKHEKYMWEPGFKGTVYKFKDKHALDSGMALLVANASDDELIKGVNTKSNPEDVSIQKGRYEFSHFTDVTKDEIDAGYLNKYHHLTKPLKNANGSYTVVKVEEIYNSPAPKTLDEARGYVVAEYQEYLEKQWNDKMRKKYPLKEDEKVFKSMVKK